MNIILKDKYGNEFTVEEVQMFLEGKIQKQLPFEYVGKKGGDWLTEAEKAEFAEKTTNRDPS